MDVGAIDDRFPPLNPWSYSMTVPIDGVVEVCGTADLTLAHRAWVAAHGALPEVVRVMAFQDECHYVELRSAESVRDLRDIDVTTFTDSHRRLIPAYGYQIQFTGVLATWPDLSARMSRPRDARPATPEPPLPDGYRPLIIREDA